MEKAVQEAVEKALQEEDERRRAIDQETKNVVRLLEHFADMQKREQEAEEERRRKRREDEQRRNERDLEDEREEDARMKRNCWCGAIIFLMACACVIATSVFVMIFGQ